MRPALLCVQRVAPLSAFAAEASAADWMRDMCPPGVYATLTTTRQRTMLHRLSARCHKLASAYQMLMDSSCEEPVSAHADMFATSLRVALAREAALRFLPGEELHITLHASPVDEALHVYVQPSPPPPGEQLEATLSLPLEQALRAVRDDVRRGSRGGWATPMMHPTLSACEGGRGGSGDFEEILLHEKGSGRVIEGLNSNLFVVSSDGALHTASLVEGAYPGSVRETVLRLAARTELFPGGIVESAPTVAALQGGEWSEAWLTCSNRKVAPLSRVWMPAAEGRGKDGEWAALQSSCRGRQLCKLLEDEMVTESEPIY